jgi:hypothetical protein
VFVDNRIAAAEQHTPSPDAVIARIAQRQHGVITLAQLLAAGLSRGAITRRLAKGLLHRIHTGVYAVGHTGLSQHGRWAAAVLATGPGSALSHLSAADLRGISRFHALLVAVLPPHNAAPTAYKSTATAPSTPATSPPTKASPSLPSTAPKSTSPTPSPPTN